jgi:opacity protein-like surface antigen
VEGLQAFSKEQIMKHRKVFTALAVFVLVSLASVQAADISGTWTASFDTQIGKQSYTYEFKVTGTQLTGKTKSDNAESEIKDGKVEGDNVTFVENLNFQGMELKITYTGKIASDNEIKFTRNVADIAMEELVAKRVK